MRHVLAFPCALALFAALPPPDAGAQFVASGHTNALIVGSKPPILSAEAEVETQSGEGILRIGEGGAIRVSVTNRGGATAIGVLGAIHTPAGPGSLQVPNVFALGNIEAGETKTEEIVIKALPQSVTADIRLEIDLRGSPAVKAKVDPVAVKVRPVSTVNDHAGPTIEIFDQAPRAWRSIRPLRTEKRINTSKPAFLLSGIVRDSSGVQQVTAGGKEIPTTWSPGGMLFEQEFQLRQGENVIEVTASDMFGNLSRVALGITRDDNLIEGRFFALLIAVQDYEDPKIPPLSKPIEDAERLGATLRDNYTFDPARITILRNPNREQILEEFTVLRNTLGEGDNLLIFYAGHGNEDKQAGMGYWLPSNAAWAEKSNWLSNSDVRAEIRALNVRHAFVITDACFSGALLVTRSTPQEVSAQRLYELPSRRGMTSGNATVPEPSVFLEQVILALKSNKEHYLPAQDLYFMVRNNVISNSPMKQVPNCGVIPEAGDQGGDFVFVRR